VQGSKTPSSPFLPYTQWPYNGIPLLFPCLQQSGPQRPCQWGCGARGGGVPISRCIGLPNCGALRTWRSISDGLAECWLGLASISSGGSDQEIGNEIR